MSSINKTDCEWQVKYEEERMNGELKALKELLLNVSDAKDLVKDSNMYLIKNQTERLYLAFNDWRLVLLLKQIYFGEKINAEEKKEEPQNG